MKYEEVMKKLEEIKVEAYNNLSSGEEESELQVESATEEPNEEPAGGEEVKVKTPKPENVKAPKTLSRTTSMDGGKGADKSVYLTDATLKATQQKLDELKDVLKREWPQPEDLDDDYPERYDTPQSGKWGNELMTSKDETKAKLLIDESIANPNKFNPVHVEMLRHELAQNPINQERLKEAIGLFTQG